MAEENKTEQPHNDHSEYGINKPLGSWVPLRESVESLLKSIQEKRGS